MDKPDDLGIDLRTPRDPCECGGCWPCPECHGRIPEGAVRCRHCGAYVGGFLGSPTGLGCRWGFFLALVLVLLLVLACCCGLPQFYPSPS